MPFQSQCRPRSPLSSGARRGLEHCNCALFPQENECVPAASVKSAEPLDIGSFQYPSAARLRSALLQELDSSNVFGSPTWARTRDLRINSRPLDLSATRHECSALGVLVSNTSLPASPQQRPGKAGSEALDIGSLELLFYAGERGIHNAIGTRGRPSATWVESPNRRSGVGRAAGR